MSKQYNRWPIDSINESVGGLIDILALLQQQSKDGAINFNDPEVLSVLNEQGEKTYKKNAPDAYTDKRLVEQLKNLKLIRETGKAFDEIKLTDTGQRIAVTADKKGIQRGILEYSASFQIPNAGYPNQTHMDIRPFRAILSVVNRLEESDIHPGLSTREVTLCSLVCHNEERLNEQVGRTVDLIKQWRNTDRSFEQFYNDEIEKDLEYKPGTYKKGARSLMRLLDKTPLFNRQQTDEQDVPRLIPESGYDNERRRILQSYEQGDEATLPHAREADLRALLQDHRDDIESWVEQHDHAIAARLRQDAPNLDDLGELGMEGLNKKLHDVDRFHERSEQLRQRFEHQLDGAKEQAFLDRVALLTRLAHSEKHNRAFQIKDFEAVEADIDPDNWLGEKYDMPKLALRSEELLGRAMMRMDGDQTVHFNGQVNPEQDHLYSFAGSGMGDVEVLGEDWSMLAEVTIGKGENTDRRELRDDGTGVPDHASDLEAIIHGEALPDDPRHLETEHGVVLYVAPGTTDEGMELRLPEIVREQAHEYNQKHDVPILPLTNEQFEQIVRALNGTDLEYNELAELFHDTAIPAPDQAATDWEQSVRSMVETEFALSDDHWSEAVQELLQDHLNNQLPLAKQVHDYAIEQSDDEVVVRAALKKHNLKIALSGDAGDEVTVEYEINHQNDPSEYSSDTRRIPASQAPSTTRRLLDQLNERFLAQTEKNTIAL